MSYSLIDGLRVAAKGFIDPVMEKFYHQSAEEDAQWEALEKLVEPLDNEIAEKILECASGLAAAADANAFTDGFRMAFNLMMESLDSRGTEKRREST